MLSRVRRYTVRALSDCCLPSTTGIRLFPGNGWTSLKESVSRPATSDSSIDAAASSVGTRSTCEVGASSIRRASVVWVPVRAMLNGTRVASS